MSDYPALGLDDKMPFGQYETEPVWWVIEHDPDYVCWLIDEADVDVQLDNEAYEVFEAIVGRAR